MIRKQNTNVHVSLPENVLGFVPTSSDLDFTDVQTCTIANIVRIIMMLCSNNGISKCTPNLENV